MVWVAASVITVCSLLGVAMTIIGLPGTWLMLLVAVVSKVLVPDVMSWWMVGVAGGFVLAAEIADFASSAVGAKAGGASKKGMTGALVGSLLGAIAGTVFLSFLPVLGTIIGGVAGAAAGAIIIERSSEQKTWKESGKAGAGAAVGRFASTFIKAGLAIGMGLTLTIAAFWPYSADDPALQNPSDQPSGMIQPE